jgi:circadian clock protein KaiB
MKIKPTIAKSAPTKDGPAKAKSDNYILRLYVAGLTPKSERAIANVKKICEENLQGRYELEVVDLYQQPQLARGDQIVAVPTLIKKLPLPLRRILGDMSQTERVLVGLDLMGKADAKEARKQ